MSADLCFLIAVLCFLVGTGGMLILGICIVCSEEDPSEAEAEAARRLIAPRGPDSGTFVRDLADEPDEWSPTDFDVAFMKACGIRELHT